MVPKPCLFCQMIRGESATPVVFEDEVSFGFLDRRPLFPGHCLLVPRRHYETLGDLPRDLLDPFFADVQLLTRAIEEAMEAEGSFVAMNNRISQSVPHLHVHIVPRRRKDGLRGFFWPRGKYPDEEAVTMVQARIRQTIARLVAESPSQEAFLL